MTAAKANSLPAKNPFFDLRGRFPFVFFSRRRTQSGIGSQNREETIIVKCKAMNTKISLLLAGWLWVGTAWGDEYRVWTKRDGQKIEAALMSADLVRGHIMIRTRADQRFMIPVDKLTSDDVAFLRKRDSDMRAQQIEQMRQVEAREIARRNAIDGKNERPVPESQFQLDTENYQDRVKRGYVPLDAALGRMQAESELDALDLARRNLDNQLQQAEQEERVLKGLKGLDMDTEAGIQGLRRLLQENPLAAGSAAVNRYLEAQADAVRGLVRKQPQLGGRIAGGQPVYITKTDAGGEDVLKLENGAVVKIKIGFLGLAGVRKDAVLYKDGWGWKIWIEGKRAYGCEILREPETKPSGFGEVISISEVKGDGEFLKTLDGSLLEVGELHTIEASLWIGPFDALLIDDSRLVNLEYGREIIDVTELR